MTPYETFIEWLRIQAETEGKSSREWEASKGAVFNTIAKKHYHAGAANAFLEVQDYVERHPELFYNGDYPKVNYTPPNKPPEE